MAGMYPENKNVTIYGEEVLWPGLRDGKFTNGDFSNPTSPPSFIPAETLNLILDNLSEVVTGAGHVPNSTSGSQVLEAIEQMIKDSKIEFFTNNFYVQFSDIKDEDGVVICQGNLDPGSIYNFEGYRWKEIPFNGHFLRPVGEGVKAFGSGFETDKMRNLIGYGGWVNGKKSTPSGMCWTDKVSNPSYASGEWTTFFPLFLDASRYIGTNHVGAEIHPKYLSVIYWILEKN